MGSRPDGFYEDFDVFLSAVIDARVLRRGEADASWLKAAASVIGFAAIKALWPRLAAAYAAAALLGPVGMLAASVTAAIVAEAALKTLLRSARPEEVELARHEIETGREVFRDLKRLRRDGEPTAEAQIDRLHDKMVGSLAAAP